MSLPPLSQRLSAHGSYNEQHLLSPPFSDGSDHESHVHAHSPKLVHAARVSRRLRHVRYPWLVRLCQRRGMTTMRAQETSRWSSPRLISWPVNDKLAGIKASEPEPEYMNQCVSTESVADADVGVPSTRQHDDNAPSQRPLALRFCVKYALGATHR